MKVKLLSRVQLLATPWIAAYQAPLPMGFSRQDPTAPSQTLSPQLCPPDPPRVRRSGQASL